VLLLADPQGVIKSASARSSTPYGAFDEVALAAARQSRLIWESAPPDDRCVQVKYVFCMEEKRGVRVRLEECHDGRSRR
jgi:hypothetical protein